MKITKPDITISNLFSYDNNGIEHALNLPYEDADTAHTLNDGQR